MPTPFELIRDPVAIAIFALYAALLACDALVPAQALPRVRGRWARGLASFAA